MLLSSSTATSKNGLRTTAGYHCGAIINNSRVMYRKEEERSRLYKTTTAAATATAISYGRAKGDRAEKEGEKITARLIIRSRESISRRQRRGICRGQTRTIWPAHRQQQQQQQDRRRGREKRISTNDKDDARNCKQQRRLIHPVERRNRLRASCCCYY